MDFNSLQGYLERQHVAEFCDVEDDPSKVSKFIDILFPDFKTMKSMNIQRTLALLRPEVYEDMKGRKGSTKYKLGGVVGLEC